MGDNPRETVVFLHGIIKSTVDFLPASLYFRSLGYRTYAPSYSVHWGGIDAIADRIWAKLQKKGLTGPSVRLHFVAHSLGGLVADSLIRRHAPENLGRVVMWGAPLQGCEYADNLDRSAFWGPLFRVLYGQAGMQVRVAFDEPARKRPVAYPAGMIAGTRSYNPMARWHLKDAGPHDGVVPLARTRREGLADHLVLDVSHPGLLIRPCVWRQTAQFLKCGRFSRRP